ncbi:MAG: hypothetical protein QOH21_3237 [Acidobacteriota bacterium]|jgi:hypothetical protein|nr:hypothetical protein [Acidobacteriota bacterium]
MNNDQALRDHLQYLLEGKGAHAGFDDTVNDFPAALRGRRPDGSPHSAWELLEHLRLAQWDILDYIRNPDYVAPEFPAGYWPASPEPPNEQAWDESVAAFHADVAALRALVAEGDLLAPIVYAKNATIVGQVLLAADHNAYHLGQLLLVRRLLGAWDHS